MEEEIKYVENFDMSITDYLEGKKNYSIKRILDMLDISDISLDHKKKIRKIILDELNDFYDSSCTVIVYLQENGLGSKKT